ncbi:MAG: nucleotidyltransferase domain-containing protein [Candidatus Cloacimonetes bacterium]|nr:nucleotidyltransferase domain-containing protein [Candidatus Cloacimonadota bacterium]
MKKEIIQSNNVALGSVVVTLTDVNTSNGLIKGRGSMGSITRVPYNTKDKYTIQLLDSSEVFLTRENFQLKGDYYDSNVINSSESKKISNLNDFVIYKCIVGSKAYGLETESSDTDTRGFYLPPSDLHWSLYGVPEQLEDQQSDECYWEIEKFLKLALKANPNILECLYSPVIVKSTPIADEILQNKHIFLSKLVYQTYNGYVLNQFKKLNHEFSKCGQVKWKHAMHIIRLLLSGISTIRDGFVNVDISSHREQLLAIKTGKLEWSEVNKWRLALHKDFESQYKKTPLPEFPDYQKANELLIQARKEMVSKNVFTL